jgi:hypothetical protein
MLTVAAQPAFCGNRGGNYVAQIEASLSGALAVLTCTRVASMRRIDVIADSVWSGIAATCVTSVGYIIRLRPIELAPREEAPWVMSAYAKWAGGLWSPAVIAICLYLLCYHLALYRNLLSRQSPLRVLHYVLLGLMIGVAMVAFVSALPGKPNSLVGGKGVRNEAGKGCQERGSQRGSQRGQAHLLTKRSLRVSLPAEYAPLPFPPLLPHLCSFPLRDNRRAG